MNQSRPVRKIGSLVGQLLSRRGYAQVLAGEEFQRAIEVAIGPQAAATVRVGNLRRGVLDLYAADSVTLQELTFQKRSILRQIQQDLPHTKVTDLRFRIQAS